MTIQVWYFASLRELVGRGRERREVAEGATPASVLREVLGSERAAHASGVAFAVNRRHVPGDRALRDGDELAFLPPLSGG